jgi:CDP-glucose 4,6-dehydratase
MLTKYYGRGELKDVSDPNALHEANLLMLDISKAKFRLGWEPRTNIEQCMELVADWYKRYLQEDVYRLCVEQTAYFGSINYKRI